MSSAVRKNLVPVLTVSGLSVSQLWEPGPAPGALWPLLPCSGKQADGQLSPRVRSECLAECLDGGR